MAFGAPGAETAWRTSGSLGDFAAAQAPRADADALGRAVDQGAHGLEVRLEPTRPDVVGMRYRPAHDWTLIADFAPLRHNPSCCCVAAGRTTPANPEL